MKLSHLIRSCSQICLLGFVAVSPCWALSDTELVQDWNNAIIKGIRQDSSPPGIASRKMAMFYTAMFDAVNALEPQYEAYIEIEPPIGDLDPLQAAIGAAFRIAELEFPGFSGAFRDLKDKQLRAIGQPDFEAQSFGAKVAERMLKHRSNDGSSNSITYIPRDEIGIWKRTPPKFRPPETPQWEHVIPFSVPLSSDLLTPGPPPLSSEDYARAWIQVKALGAIDSSTRTPEQTEIAHFWSCFTYTATPAGHWNQIACNIIAARDLPLIESLRLLALMNLALADAGIHAWKAKYEHHFWRPLDAVHLADQDNNPQTSTHLTWDSLLEAPPHPEYVSGHSTYTGAGAEVLRRFMGTDRISFSTTSESLPGVVRQFETISDCENEIGMSRIYGGIHFIFSNLDGLELGRQVGRYTFDNYLIPVAH